MGYRIGVISDTHGLLRDEVKEQLRGCDMIFHAGDINCSSVIDELNQIAPTYVVRGNADKEWASNLPQTQVITDIGIRVLMIHNKKLLKENLESFDLIIYGHSHKYEEKIVRGRRWLNPGSCGPRRFKLPITMAMLYIEDDGDFRIERIDIGCPGVQATDNVPVESVKKYLPAVIREIDKGTSVNQIAVKFHLSHELAEQICRLYLTHPGVDADGIMAKMGM